MSGRVGRSLTIRSEGPIRGRLEPGHVHRPVKGTTIRFAKLDELRPLGEFLKSLLDAGEQERAQRFRYDLDRERFLLGHGALRMVLGQCLDRDPVHIRFQRGPHGKPFVEDATIPFNLSDTKDAIAIAVGERTELGVDVETMDRPVDHTAVGEHYFTLEEQASIAQAEDGKRRFLEYWTRKEAVLKASGVGIMDDLRVLRVDQDLNRMTITHEAFITLAAPEYHVRTWHLGDAHIISLASALELGEVSLLDVR